MLCDSLWPSSILWFKKMNKKKYEYLLPFCRLYHEDILKNLLNWETSVMFTWFQIDIIYVIVIYMQSRIYDKRTQML